MDDSPCPLCGYDAPELPCAHCARRTAEPSLARDAPGAFGGVVAGLLAVPRGLQLLAFTPRVKRLLVPPVVLTALTFTAAMAWAWSAVAELLEAARLRDVGRLDLEEGWLRDAAEWLIERSLVIWAAQAAGWILFLLVSSLVAMWTFSIVYEALAGPFLDEIQGRFETRWFGTNPRDDIERPTDLAASRCALFTTLGAAGGVALLAVLWQFSGCPWWAAGATALVPLALLAVLHREYGKWLRWVLRVEGRTLWVSVKASIMAGAIVLLFFPIRFVPFGIGYLAFGAIAGFATAITLLDIPFERRQWSLGTRMRFVRIHLPAMIGYGVVASLLFVIPVLGPVLMVPAASVGGLWLLCRLDKTPLRAGPGAGRAG